MKIFCEKGNQIINEKAYSTASTLKRGQVVKLSGGSAAAASASETAQLLGICLENKTGSVRVADGPALVFMCPAPEITVTTGSVTTVSASALGSFSDDAFNGGKLMLTYKASGSTNSGSIGDSYSVSDYDGTDKEFTLGTTLTGAPVAGDKYRVFPPIGSCLGALSSDSESLVLTTATANFSIRVVGWDLKNRAVYLMANSHVYGNKQ